MHWSTLAVASPTAEGPWLLGLGWSGWLGWSGRSAWSELSGGLGPVGLVWSGGLLGQGSGAGGVGRVGWRRSGA